jgi:hypothetical protein
MAARLPPPRRDVCEARNDDESTSFCRANGPKDAAGVFPVAGISSQTGVRAGVSRQSPTTIPGAEREKHENHVKPRSESNDCDEHRGGGNGNGRAERSGSQFEIPKLS